MQALQKRYGAARGKRIYYMMENMAKHGDGPANAPRKAVGKKKGTH